MWVDGRNEWARFVAAARLWQQCDDEADSAGGVEGLYSARGPASVENARLSVTLGFVCVQCLYTFSPLSLASDVGMKRASLTGVTGDASKQRCESLCVQRGHINNFAEILNGIVVLLFDSSLCLSKQKACSCRRYQVRWFMGFVGPALGEIQGI